MTAPVIQSPRFITEAEWRELRAGHGVLSPELLARDWRRRRRVSGLSEAARPQGPREPRHHLRKVSPHRRDVGHRGDAALTSAAGASAGGMDCFYIGYNLEMAREFIDTSRHVGQDF